MKKEEIIRVNYQIQGVDDVIHHFSPPKYELLSEVFLAYMDHLRPALEEAEAVELEVTGGGLDEEAQEAMERALRVHYRLDLADAVSTLQKGLIRAGWFLLSMLLSGVILYLVREDTSEAAVQFLYLPIWFFGYRLLTYLVLEFPRQWREKKRLEKLAEIRLKYEGHPISKLLSAMSSKQKHKAIVDDYFMEGDLIQLECRISSEAEILNGSMVDGREMISEELSDYLEKAVPFLKHSHSVSLLVNGEIGGQAVDRIRNGIRWHFQLRRKELTQKLKENQRRIAGFTAGLLLASIVLNAFCAKIGLAYHEIVLIILWFFGDYLAEYIVLTQKELLQQKKIWEKMEEMEVVSFRK